MNLTLLEAAAERLIKARQAQEKAECELRAAEEEMQRVREKIQALGIDPDNLDEGVKKLGQIIEAELNKMAA